MDGRLLAAFRSLYEAAAPALAQLQQASSSSSSSGGGGSTAQLGSSWPQHLRRAVARRSQEVLAGMPTSVLQDLEQLAGWEWQSGDAPHSWGPAQAHYSATIAAYETQCGSLVGAAAAAVAGSGSATAVDAGAAALAEGGSTNEQPLLDAGAAGQDAALAALLLQQARQAEQAQGAAPSGSTQQPESSGSSSGSGSILPVIYRAYKKLILTDAILLAD